MESNEKAGLERWILTMVLGDEEQVMEVMQSDRFGWSKVISYPCTRNLS
jgi:hypothetical protein